MENCPYCNAKIEINHDDGYGYSEDEKHEQECGSCGKKFVYNTSVHFYYSLEKADCLNDSDHDYQPTVTVPRECTMMRCTMCDDERQCSKEEMERILTNT